MVAHTESSDWVGGDFYQFFSYGPELFDLAIGDVMGKGVPAALIGAAAISFLMSFENFNTTLMLVGSDPPLTVMMYGRMREGATPVLNAVSLFLMLEDDVQVGDILMISVGNAIQKMTDQEAELAWEMYDEILQAGSV